MTRKKPAHIAHKDHVTKEEAGAKIEQVIGPHEDLTITKRRKLQWYDHISHPNLLARHSEKGVKTRLAKEEVGRQHRGMDRAGVWQVPEGGE